MPHHHTHGMHLIDTNPSKLVPESKQPLLTCLPPFPLLQSNMFSKWWTPSYIISMHLIQPWQRLSVPLQHDRPMEQKISSFYAANFLTTLQPTKMPPFSSSQVTWSSPCIWLHHIYPNLVERAEWVDITFWPTTKIPSKMVPSSLCPSLSKTRLVWQLKQNWLHFFTSTNKPCPSK